MKRIKILLSLFILVIISSQAVQAQKSQAVIAATWKNGTYKCWIRVRSTSKFALQKERQKIEFFKNKVGEVYEIKLIEGKSTHRYEKDDKDVQFVRYFTDKEGGNWNLFFTTDRILVFKAYISNFTAASEMKLIAVIGKKPKVKKDEKALVDGLLDNWKVQKVQVQAYVKKVRAERARKKRAREKQLREKRSAQYTAELQRRKNLQPGAYRLVGNFSEGLAVVSIDGKAYGLINKKGKVVVPVIYDDIAEFREGLARIQDVQERYGFIDKTGKVVIPFSNYSRVGHFSEGLAWVTRKGKYRQSGGFIDKLGNVKIPLASFRGELRSFSEGLAAFKNKGKWGFINKRGTVTMDSKYLKVKSCSEGAVWVAIQGKNGYLNAKGRVMHYTTDYKYAYSYSEGLALIGKTSDSWGFINKRGQWAIPAKYEDAFAFHKGMARVKSNGKWGFINQQGEWMIPAKYTYVENFHEGLAQAKSNGKWGFINQQGKWVVPAKYKSAKHFSDGWAKVERTNDWAFINKSGQVMLTLKKRR